MEKFAKFSERLAHARKSAGLTQEEVASALRCHKFTVSKWEQAITKPGNPTDYDVLGHLLNVSVPWLRDGQGEMGPYVAPPSSPPLSDRRRRALTAPGIPPRSAQGGPGPDWRVVGYLARQLLAMAPGLSEDQLGRALALAYGIHQRGAWDEDMAHQVVAGV